MTCNIIVTWNFITQTLRTKYEQTQVYDESSFPQGLEPNPKSKTKEQDQNPRPSGKIPTKEQDQNPRPSGKIPTKAQGQKKTLRNFAFLVQEISARLSV